MNPPVNERPALGIANEKDLKMHMGLITLFFSPGVVCSVAIVGYYSLAALLSETFFDSNIVGVAIRASSICILLVSFLFTSRAVRLSTGQALIPLTIFLMIYAIRLMENVLNDVTMVFSPETMLPIFFGSGMLSAYFVSKVGAGIRDVDITIASAILCVLFMAALVLNSSEILATASDRLSLTKINPISLAYTSLYYMTLCFFYFRSSHLIKLLSPAVFVACGFVMIYARSRGPILACVCSIVIYVTLLKGEKKIRTFAVLIVLALLGAGLLDQEKLEVLWSRFEKTDIVTDRSTYLHHLAFVNAWQQFLDDPIAGRYVIELTTQVYPHNLIMESLMSVGMIGSIPLIIHLVASVRAAVGLIRTKGLPIFCSFFSVLFFQELIASMFSGSIWSDTNFWILSSLVVSLWYGRSPGRRSLHQMTKAVSKSRSGRIMLDYRAFTA